MTFLNKLFGRKKESKQEGPVALLEDVLDGMIDTGKFELTYSIDENSDGSEILVEFQGADEELLTAREGLLLDSFQLFLKRVLQHQLPDLKVNLNVDCAGFREAANQALIELADKLKEIALSKGKSVYFRALAPKDRKVVHQHLAEDGRVKSRSIGDGHFKKIKIYPVKSGEETQSTEQPSN